MIPPRDMEHCVEAIRHGSLSFHAASKLLPQRLRDPALALYAFCRLADDAVDLHPAKADAVLSLHERLDMAYAGTPRDAPADRAFTAVIDEFGMPRALPEALLEGLAWDAMERRYASLSDLRAYSARVAAAVGAMMCVLMRVRDPNTLARACDLGVAMQLTNIARDVGEDACEGRLYLPTDWMAEAGIAPEAFLKDPQPNPQVRMLVRRLLREADDRYARCDAGIAELPLSCRPGIFAARHIYGGINRRVRAGDHDTITQRARTSSGQKLGWVMLAFLRGAGTVVMPRSPMLYARPLPETAFLVEAAGDPHAGASDWSDTLYKTMAQLKTKDHENTVSLLRNAPHARTSA